jgi:hypothetical protein
MEQARNHLWRLPMLICIKVKDALTMYHCFKRIEKLTARPDACAKQDNK